MTEGSLEKLFDGNVARVVEHLIVHERWEQNQKDMCDALQMHSRAVKMALERLVALGIVRVTRRIAKSKFYEVNQRSELVAPLRILTQKLGEQLALEEARRRHEGEESEVTLA